VDLAWPRLDEGSEHLVLFDEATSEVVKICVRFPRFSGLCVSGWYCAIYYMATKPKMAEKCMKVKLFVLLLSGA
jgi:hypothetical protein